MRNIPHEKSKKYARCTFHHIAGKPLCCQIFISDSLYWLKTVQFNQAFAEHWSDLPPAPLKLRLYGAIEIRLLLLLWNLAYEIKSPT